MIPLNAEATAMLRQSLVRFRPDLLPVVDSPDVVSVDEVLGNQLRGAVGEEFLRVGLKEDWEPNELGLKLEKLIDDIGRLFMPPH